MTDLEKAKSNLSGHTIALCKDGNLLFSEKRGISPMMEFIAENKDLSGYSVADLVVGKAAAMLFVKAKIAKVHAVTLSQSGKAFLEKYNIPVTYDTLAEHIINRNGTDICPMERTVLDCEDAQTGYNLLKEKLIAMQKTN